MIKKLFLAVLVLIIAAVVFKDAVLKTAIGVGTSQLTGASASIEHFSLSVLKQKVSIKGFQISQPQGFPAGTFVDIPEVSVSFNVPELLRGRMYFPAVVVNLKEMVVIKNSDGKLNVDAMKFAQKKEAPAGSKKGTEKQPGQMPPLKIDILTLTVGGVVVKDYTKGSDPTVVAYDAGIKDKVFRDINSAEQLAALIMVQAMGPTAIKSAGIYAAATALGVAFLPAGVAGVLLGDDNSAADYPVSLEAAYQASVAVLKQMGQVSSENKEKGLIKGKVEGCDITVEIKALTEKKTQLKVSARKLLLPKPDIAGGVLYNIGERLK